MLVVDGHPVDLDAHLARLEASLAELYPGHIPPSDVPSLRHPYRHLSDGTSGLGSLRVSVAPAGGEKLEARITVREVKRQAHEVSLRGLVLPGGLGAHKWADRSLLDEAQAGLPADTLPLVADADGSVLEASRANVFVVRGGRLLTPPTDGRILPGVTRMRVLEIAAAMGIETDEKALATNDLLNANEVFLSGSIRGIERVGEVDGVELTADGEVGPTIAAELWESWKPVQVG